MLILIFRKMLNKKWMILSLLIGNVLLISIAMINPMYVSAVTQNLLTRTLSDSYAATGVYPGIAKLSYSLSKSASGNEASPGYFDAALDMKNLPVNMGAETLYEITYNVIEDYSAKRDVVREDQNENLKLAIASMTDIENHINLIEGEVFSSEPDENGVYDILVSRTAFVKKDLLMNEVYTFEYVLDKDGNRFKARIAGVFESNDDCYWVETSDYYATQIFLPENVFNELFIDRSNQRFSVSTEWYALIDYQKLMAKDVVTSLYAVDELNEKYNFIYLKPFTTEFEALLRTYLTEANQATATLKVLQMPVFALLIAFIFMVSRQILEIEQSEIAVLKSRGASGGQVFRLYLTQSFLLSLIGLAISVPFSAFLCGAIGSANAFLEFVSRSSLNISYSFEVMAYAFIAALVGVFAMTLPAVSYSRHSIVDIKRSKQSNSQTPVWQKFGLDIILLGISLYGLYAFNNQRDILSAKAASGAALDPLIYISSSLFAVGASLFMVRIVPLIALAVFKLFGSHLRPSLYVSFLQVLRSKRSQVFMTMFLLLTIAIGFLNADTACTVNTSKETQLKYDIGADIVLKEAWLRSNGEYVQSDSARYSQIEGVESVAKVFIDNMSGAVYGQKSLSGVRLMGIDAKSFGETAYMPDNLLAEHFFTYLNSMSQTINGCLLSDNFKALGFMEGDTISIKSSTQPSVNLMICGFVDYFPTYNPTVYETLEDGSVVSAQRYMVVANLGFLQSAWGLEPYEIWIKAPDGIDNVVKYANESGTRYWEFSDISTRMDTLKNSPSIQGTNGILTLSFIVGLALCAVGFLIYWVLSIKSRSLQFGIYRAMGMSAGEIIAMLINEHLWQSVIPIAAGALIGYVTSALYIPLIQIAYSSADSSLPLSISRDTTDHIRLIIIILIALAACVGVLIALIRKLKIAQALKLGED